MAVQDESLILTISVNKAAHAHALIVNSDESGKRPPWEVNRDERAVSEQEPMAAAVCVIVTPDNLPAIVYIEGARRLVDACQQSARRVECSKRKGGESFRSSRYRVSKEDKNHQAQTYDIATHRGASCWTSLSS